MGFGSRLPQNTGVMNPGRLGRRPPVVPRRPQLGGPYQPPPTTTPPPGVPQQQGVGLGGQPQLGGLTPQQPQAPTTLPQPPAQLQTGTMLGAPMANAGGAGLQPQDDEMARRARMAGQKLGVGLLG